MEITNYNKDQVFINFRGEDVRNGLLCYLKQKLVDGNVNVFTDENVIGQRLENLFEQILNSKIAIVIFSESYADSVWCLRELDLINKCIETKKLKAVIPIFYKVKVSSVKKQKGKFGEKFRDLRNYLLAKEVNNKKETKHINSMIKEWKKALKDVTGIAGLTYRNTISEMDFLEKVVEKVKINLANIAAEERRNSILETSEISLGRQSNQNIFNVNQLNINIQLHRSKSLEALRPSYNPEGHSKSIDLKPSSPTIRRTASDLDHRDQYRPFPFEARMVPKQKEKQRRIVKIVPIKIKRWHNLHFVSALLFGALFVSYMMRSKSCLKESRK